MNNLHAFLYGLALSFIILSTYIIVDTARSYKPPVVRQATWAPPKIEQCAKELWERIEEGCDE